VNPLNTGHPFTTDRGNIRGVVVPNFGAAAAGVPPGITTLPQGQIPPDNGVPCILRSAVPPPHGGTPLIPAGAVLVNPDGTTKLFLADTPGVGAVPAGFDPIVKFSGDWVDGEGELVEGEEGKSGAPVGMIAGATAAAVVVLLLAAVVVLLLKSRRRKPDYSEHKDIAGALQHKDSQLHTAAESEAAFSPSPSTSSASHFHPASSDRVVDFGPGELSLLPSQCVTA
jgi:hypothetical protein